MFQTFLSKLTIWLLKRKTLSGESKMRVTNALLENLYSLPIRDVIGYDSEGTLVVNGRKLDFDQAQSLVQSAMALQDNFARKVIHDQVNYEAIKMGIHNGLTADTILFAKAALWYMQEENRVLSQLISK